MTTFVSNVPVPAIPESNESYRKRVDAMQKLAGKASALTQALELVTGVNTYAKILRRYTEALIVEANGGPLPVDNTPPPAGAVSVNAVLAALGDTPAAPETPSELADMVAAAKVKNAADAAAAKADKAAAAQAAKLAKLEAREKAATAKEAAAAAAKAAKPVKAPAKPPVMGTAKPKAAVLTPEERKAKQAADRKRQRDAVKVKEAAGE